MKIILSFMFQNMKVQQSCRAYLDARIGEGGSPGPVGVLVQGEASRQPLHHVLVIEGVVAARHVGPRIDGRGGQRPHQRAVFVLESHLGVIPFSLLLES